MSVTRFSDLLVWQKGVDFVIQLYGTTRNFPKDEIYGLTSQMRRAAVSIPSNIAEGHGRNSTGDYLRFLALAQGSCSELETQLLIASRLKYLSKQDWEDLLTNLLEIARMLSGLIASLRRRAEAHD